ncbi:hypothetical protein H2248_002884 [Termitomyces sp. 'cryptogamus']|nr:hypothetical protein H2248_002884 [Termitomyces sp. 'cryptogamus']
MSLASTSSSTTTLTSLLLLKEQPRNYEAAFGALSATYGFGSGAVMPTPPPMSPTCQCFSSSPTTTGSSVTPSHPPNASAE